MCYGENAEGRLALRKPGRGEGKRRRMLCVVALPSRTTRRRRSVRLTRPRLEGRSVRASMTAVNWLLPISKSRACFFLLLSIPKAITIISSPVLTPLIRTTKRLSLERFRPRKPSSCSRLLLTHMRGAALLLIDLLVWRSAPRLEMPSIMAEMMYSKRLGWLRVAW